MYFDQLHMVEVMLYESMPKPQKTFQSLSSLYWKVSTWETSPHWPPKGWETFGTEASAIPVSSDEGPDM